MSAMSSRPVEVGVVLQGGGALGAYECGALIALLELMDYAPLPVREPVRSLVWVRGRLQPVPPDAVTDMLEAVLKIQYEGDRAAADAFIDRWTTWNDELHELVAKTIRDNHQF